MASDQENISEFIIQTRYNFRTEFIIIKNLDLQTYLNECGKKFLINFDIKHDVHLSNNNNATIEKSQFEKIIQTYWKSASFFVNLIATPQKTDSVIITPKVNIIFIFKLNVFKIFDIICFVLEFLGS